ncbi:hypothetical protein [Corallococcus macrosporus]|uniref:hypothetical protein n=1 Tax=Corallococcus macrosporus TaxID=35 RepID=UPI000F4DD587|nr:hypothetical protein [Corallococcus macrosporus]
MDSLSDFKRNASRLKMRGMRLRAEGGWEKRFEAAVALHDAARLERAVRVSLVDGSWDVRLVCAIEECGCYVDAGAPRSARRAWGDIAELLIHASDHRVGVVRGGEQSVREPMFVRDVGVSIPGMIHYMGEREIAVPRIEDSRLGKLSERFAEQQREFYRAVRKCAVLRNSASRGALVPNGLSERAKLERELETLIGLFPGDAHLWFSLYRVRESLGRPGVAIASLYRAFLLEPYDDALKVMYMYALSRSADHVDEYVSLLNAVFENRYDESHEALVFHALGMMRIAKNEPAHRDVALGTAREDLRLASLKSPRRGSSMDFERTQSILETMLRGEEPSRDEMVEQGILAADSQVDFGDDWTFLMQKQLASGLGLGGDSLGWS